MSRLDEVDPPAAAEMADAVVYLALAQAVTGSVLSIDGGTSAILS